METVKRSVGIRGWDERKDVETEQRGFLGQ